MFVVAGLGCRSGCSAEAIRAVVDQALAAAGLNVGDLAALAAPDRKRAERGVHEVAAGLGRHVIFVDDAALTLVQPLCATGSDRVERLTGHRSIAEAAALAACPPPRRLLVPRRSADGATCALACQDIHGQVEGDDQAASLSAVDNSRVTAG